MTKDIKEYQAMVKSLNPSEINIISKLDNLYNIIERLQHHAIDLCSDTQRNPKLWDNIKMSRLIESILVRIPIRDFYFDASDDKKWLIIDGLQRLSAIYKFVIEKKLVLCGLEYLTDYNGQKYDDLPRTYKRRIDECSVTLFLIQPGTPEPIKHSLIRRINNSTYRDEKSSNLQSKL